MPKKQEPLTSKERLLQILTIDHRLSVRTYPCEFGDHIEAYCSCGWEGKDSIDQTYEYADHLAEELISSGLINISLDLVAPAWL